MGVGARIKELRISRGLTQDDLATAANTTKQTIHKYETGIISNIPASKIKAIADRLLTTPAYLMGWGDDFEHIENEFEDEYMNITGEIDQNDPIVKRAILNYGKLSKKDKDAFWRVIRKITE